MKKNIIQPDDSHKPVIRHHRQTPDVVVDHFLSHLFKRFVRVGGYFCRGGS